MAATDQPDGFEARLSEWRTYLIRRQAIHSVDVEELEDHLRNQVAALIKSGLSQDEAFLVAVKRMGDLDAVAREFAREYSERLWKQLVLVEDTSGSPGKAARNEAVVAVCLAVVAAVAVKVPELFGQSIRSDDTGFYVRNFSLFVLPFLTVYFVWKRRLPPRSQLWLAMPFALAIILANAFPFTPGGSTSALVALHLPIALWLFVGVAYAGGRWTSGGGRMDFVRFSGELFIYYVLIALGGGVLVGFTGGMFAAIGLEVEWLAEAWLLPCGALGAVIVSAWLVEAKQSVVENMAPVLTRLFTPLFAMALVAFLATMIWTGRVIDVERNVLIGVDLLLVLVLGLLLYAVSARDPQAPPNVFDGLQVLLLICALIVDVVALTAIATRISEFGFSANRVAALGENVILLVNLLWSAKLYGAFLVGRGRFTALEGLQMAYLPVYAVWAGIVVVVFPPLFVYR
jgi:hypothetical protein